ncbi:C4-dicarboxylate ABC transporter permease [Defluviimonas sp. WL0024]|uniref:C4-dicarboxylate ABC transporter permease n=1 Tax=Albidovulum salinarum TaxID=2984153 RepID=A0ABT2WZN4_9RHOB|nr:C4-dicarboxylate ABC transporter permease [Defluviimonas sp. WL0024]MCU9846934.1 C4-dicarboxylate ABC transporter permease [Defluviimonas sp. WL0024]
MVDAIIWVFASILGAFRDVAYAVSHPQEWLAWLPYINQTMPTPEVKESLMRFIYYGASKELFFVLLTLFLILTAVGLWRRPVMWAYVRGLEWFANGLGRLVAWAGLIMVIQQIVIVFLQRIFRVATIELGAFGIGFEKDLSWWSEELKLYNAMIVALCVTYTFVQGGHVRVDLIYAGVSYRTKKAIDMFGSLFFMIPVATLTWLFAWFFFWRVMVVPNTSASDSLDKLLLKARAVRWNIETIGFSPNGFDAYFLFKLLILSFVALTFLHALAFFWRNLLEFIEGPAAEGKHLDKDTLGQGEEAYEGTH